MSTILLITGPSGAGKTTTIREFLESASGVWAYLSQDDLRQLVVTGYHSADDYRKDWNKETQRQWNVSIPLCVDMAKRYHEAGINCVVDFYGPLEEFVIWEKHLKDLPYKLVVLLPDEETTVERNNGRDEQSKLKESIVRENHRLFDGWKNRGVSVIDTSHIEITDSVKRIKELID